MSTWKRILLEEWRDNYYHGEQKPEIKTLRERIKKGKLAGKYNGCEYIVYCDNNYEPVWPDEYQQPAQEPVIKLTGNTLADQIIMRRSQHG